jgi:hypothetical protein
VDERIAHIECGRLWTDAVFVHEVIHRWLGLESRYTALKADLEGAFHVSTVIHSRFREIAPTVINSRPQCGRSEDGCG